ncbi:NAD-glutamate dehydrogenase [Naumannella halotolerans]|uniref:NAD-glutamate dehydrogenase n=1 Tax=Naumannella halotolerans TaxID=993414 RepID=UPI00370DB8D5
MGADPARVGEFVGHYFRHVDPADVTGREVDELLELVADHYALAMQRRIGESVIAIESATDEVTGTIAVQVITDDKPFLVDSVTMEILDQGWSIREIFHPQFLVTRSADGRLERVVSHQEAAGDEGVIGESWMHLEVRRPSTTEPLAELIARLRDGLAKVLADVDVVVSDWPAMGERVAETMAELVEQGSAGPRADQRQQAIQLLDYLADDHFTFLGCRDYTVDAEGNYTPVPQTGYGILREDAAAADRFAAKPPADGDPDLLVITKDDEVASVHRAVHQDYIGIRRFDDHGRVVGERRFLGLFAAAAYADSVTHIPLLREKVAAIIEASGFEPGSHGAMAIRAVLDSYPRDELFQTRAEDLAPVAERISRLKERRRVSMFSRADDYGRFISFLVYLPRDRYNTQTRNRMQEQLLHSLGGESIDFRAMVGESVLARLHFVVRMAPGRPIGPIDVEALEEELTAATRSWDDALVDELAVQEDGERLAGLAAVLPEGYKEDFDAIQAVSDLTALADLQAQDEDMALALFLPSSPTDEADLRLKVFRRGRSIVLSQVMPHLSNLGVEVLDEYPYTLRGAEDEKSTIYEFGLAVPGGREAAAGPAWDAGGRRRFTDAFAASYSGRSESGRLNGLITSTSLDWVEVSWLRALSRYLQQASAGFSQTYIARTLLSQPALTEALVALFRARFDPAMTGDREAAVSEVRQRILDGLDTVTSLDQDRIIRALLSVIMATIRTNAFQPDARAVALKLRPTDLDLLPEPRPAFEVFVCSPQVEGVHLRFGAIARGGLRWSDRAEDFRTEVLGLVKAQMVKNTVIVPVGAKGGFYAKQLPNPATDRGAWMEAGKEAYRIFINSLLDVTDNIVDGEVVAPPDLVRHDGDDPYLVVAADKGTATFSDVANEIAARRGFWLGDAFASGGSVGYDHKGMGITARGAWESVRRHFRELGIDCQTEDFTAVGIGDMSGDVFGNGMLLSEHTKLVAAFDHRDIFIDPDPDPATSFAERRRMFDLPRSSWADYDRSLISEGGGVFDRSAKSIDITEPMRAALGIEETVRALTPSELISAILTAPVDLLWNGGIGTYVKASTETDAVVGDRTNDQLRVNGDQLRARVVGEGGNLGLTQAGRIEYARSGGRINTDFIDNSAGVDTSDHEVNIKILLAGEVAAGRLSEPDRRALLASMTDEVAELVLAHNYDQNLALANAEIQAPSMVAVHEDWIRRLERSGRIDRALETLPSSKEMARRQAAGEGLSAPELATLLAWTKIVLAEELAASDLPDDPYLADRLIQYFPKKLRELYADRMPGHRLAREIITTIAVNRFVDSSGISVYHRLSTETEAKASDVVRAQLAARSIFDVGLHETRLRHLDNKVPAQLQGRARTGLRVLVERGTRWILNNLRTPIDIAETIDRYGRDVKAIAEELPELLTGREAAHYRNRLQGLIADGLPDELAAAVARAELVYHALGIAQVAQQSERSATEVAAAYFALGQRLQLDLLGSRIDELPRDDRWSTLARGALRDDLHQLHARLTMAALRCGDHDDPRTAVEQWVAAQGDDLVEDISTIAAICDGPAELARLSVGLRVVRSLARSE